MTDKDRREITQLREAGMGYGRICGGIAASFLMQTIDILCYNSLQLPMTFQFSQRLMSFIG